MSRRRRHHLVLFLAVLAGLPTTVLAQQSRQSPASSDRPPAPVVRGGPVPNETYEAVPPPAGAPGVALAGPPGASLTLDQASELAVRNNPLLARARAQIDSKLGTAIQAGMLANPRWDTNNPQTFAGASSQYNAGFVVTIPTAGKLRLDRAAAMQDVYQARYEYVHQRFDLLTAVRQQFYHVLAQERRIEVLNELVEIAARSHAAAQQRERAGAVAETDVLLLYTDLLQARLALANARTQLEGARRALAATIGIPNLPLQDALGDLMADLRDFNEEYVRAFVATQNAAVLEAQLQITQNRILLRRAQVDPSPDFYTGPATGFGPSSGSGGKPGAQFWYNIQFNIPLWNLNQGGVRAANANVRDAVASVGILQNDLLRQTAETLAAYRIARERVQYIREFVLPTAERSQRLVQSGYAVGEKGVAEVLQALRALIQVRLDYVDALESAWTNAAALAGLLQIERFP